MTTIKPHVTRFYQVLPLMGINMVNQHPNDIQRVADAIQAIDDVPEEWWEHMIKFAGEHNVKVPMKIVTGLEQWIAFGGPPALRKSNQAATGIDISDDFINEYAHAVAASKCPGRCNNFPQCQPAWRQKALEARKQGTGVT